MRGARVGLKTVETEIPTIKCDFCPTVIDEDLTGPAFGLEKWGQIRIADGKINTYHMCPLCVKSRIGDIVYG